MAIVRPPGRVQIRGHHFEDDNVVAAGVVLVRFPMTFRRRSRNGDAAEFFRQLLADAPVILSWKRLLRIIVDRQQDLHEVHGSHLVRLG